MIIKIRKYTNYLMQTIQQCSVKLFNVLFSSKLNTRNMGYIPAQHSMNASKQMSSLYLIQIT